MQVDSPPETFISPVLKNLLDPDVPAQVCPRRARIQLDFVLLAIEALDLYASELMLLSLQELQLQNVIQNRVEFWQSRNTNPLRRSHQRQPLSLDKAKALVAVGCHIARRQTAQVRQLLNMQRQLAQQQLTPEHSVPLANYLERFRRHFRSRMNPNRTAVTAYNDNDKLDELALSLLEQVLFCTGTAGMERFWSSLFDGEVA
ncbi:MAG: DUF3038 domain-containing protein [Acaryochloris sp. RU_4_1]|nr:DUF3038 domain-containing protein [Acaryochloris sp. RU_4_1]NJR56423.1 DUF3038 domain-containing protein [Acaryochloris sp. CRU_2_0]